MTFFEPDIRILKIKKQQSEHPWERRIKEEHYHTFKTVHNSVYNPNYPEKEKLLPNNRIQVKVVGNRITKEFIFCSNLAKFLFKYKKEIFAPPIIFGVTEVEWLGAFKNLQIRFSNRANSIQSQVAVLFNDKLLGSQKEFKAFVESKFSYRFSVDYHKEGIQQLTGYINFSGRPCAYMHISVNGKDIGTLIVMLYTDIVPRTCENFLRLCGTTKGGYSGTPIHRIVRDCWIQCGGYGLKNNPELRCENFALPHNRRGVFCMANAGRDDDCSTQFFVLLQPAPWMEHKYVAFGQLIEGENTLKIIENVPTRYESPQKAVVIFKAGIFYLDGCKPSTENTNKYIERHIENLVDLREWLCEVLFEGIFKTIESKLLQIEHDKVVKIQAKNLHATERFIRKHMQMTINDNQSASESTSESKLESCETSANSNFEENISDKDSSYCQLSKTNKQTEPYYLPLTDVLYPGEVDSCFDLKRPTLPLKQNYIETHHPCKNHKKNPSYPKKLEPGSKERLRLTVIGHRIKKEFIYCYYMVKGLYKYRAKEFEEPIIRGVTDLEWPIVWKELKNKYGAKAHILQSQVAVVVNDLLLGGENELKELIESKYVYNLCLDYYHESIYQLVDYISSTGRPCVYMHFSINGEDIGSMIFMLYADLVPRTCENFLRLCELRKGGYSGTPVHRIVIDCWIQCGGYGLKNSPELGCENFMVPHDRRGVICMTNDGRDTHCSTQFFILLQPASWMEYKYVAFGQLIEGENTLTKIETVPTWYESPRQEIIIYKAGVFIMDYQYMPINKNTNEYIQGHIENLCELGQLLYEELIEKVFHEIELNQLKMAEEIDQDAGFDNIRETLYDYDEEEYDEYEDSHYSYLHGSNISLVEKPNLPYYIPLTDVPYASEIDSVYDLKRLLDGNYCYEDDLEHDIKARRFKPDFEKFYFPDELISALFECFVLSPHGSPGSTSDSYINEIAKEYKAYNMDCVSFGGPTVYKIANISEKYKLFGEKTAEAIMNRLLTDEDLRIIRLAKRKRKSMGTKKCTSFSSFDSLDTEPGSRVRLRRRLLSYVQEADKSMFNLDDHSIEDFDNEMRENEEYKQSNTFDQKRDWRRHSMAMRRTSAMLRLMDDMSFDDAPSLKDFRTNIYIDERSVLQIAQTPSLLLKQLENRRTSLSIPRFRHADLTRTGNYEHRKSDLSERKMQPSISIDQYISKNKKYRELLSAVSNLHNEIKPLERDRRRQGLRLPGDSPLYLASYTEFQPSKESLH